MKYFQGVTILLFSILCAVLFQPVSVIAAEELPEFTLTAPESDEERKYLGISSAAGEPFSISDIAADIVFIELFSMYCPYCQAEAPLVNEFHELALRQADRGVVIRSIGIGASNTQFEVDYFKETYDIDFPVFPDKTLEIYKKLKGEGTPGFLGVVIHAGQTPKIVLRQSGGFETADGFLQRLLENAGYHQQ